MNDFETNECGTAARLAVLEQRYGVVAAERTRKAEQLRRAREIGQRLTDLQRDGWAEDLTALLRVLEVLD